MYTSLSIHSGKLVYHVKELFEFPFFTWIAFFERTWLICEVRKYVKVTDSIGTKYKCFFNVLHALSVVFNISVHSCSIPFIGTRVVIIIQLLHIIMHTINPWSFLEQNIPHCIWPGFNAAVAGCFFAVETVLWPSPTESSLSLTYTTSMVILSAVTASVISEVGLGSEPAFAVPFYDFRSPSGNCLLHFCQLTLLYLVFNCVQTICYWKWEGGGFYMWNHLSLFIHCPSFPSPLKVDYVTLASCPLLLYVCVCAYVFHSWLESIQTHTASISFLSHFYICIFWHYHYATMVNVISKVYNFFFCFEA